VRGLRQSPVLTSIQRLAQCDQEETAQAQEALMRDPEAARAALAILREELQSARGPERQPLAATISQLEQDTASSG
jgi:hypothetical protein